MKSLFGWLLTFYLLLGSLSMGVWSSEGSGVRLNVSVTPATNLKTGDQVTVAVTAKPMTDLSSLQLDLVYNTAAVELMPGSIDVSGVPSSMMSLYNADVPGAIRIGAISTRDVTTNGDLVLLKAVFQVKATSGTFQFDVTETDFTLRLTSTPVNGTLSAVAALGTANLPSPTARASSPLLDETKVQAALENSPSSANETLYIPLDMQSMLNAQESDTPIFIPGLPAANMDDDIQVLPEISSSVPATVSVTEEKDSQSKSSEPLSDTSITSSSSSTETTQTSSSAQEVPPLSSGELDGATSSSPHSSSSNRPTSGSTAASVTAEPASITISGPPSSPFSELAINTLMLIILIISLAIVIGVGIILVLRNRRK